MKTRLGVMIFVFLAGIILGATQPALLYAGAETGGGNLWDSFVGTPPFPGTKLSGPLSISYDPDQSPPYCANGNYHATMFITVRLTPRKDHDRKVKGPQIYTFDEVKEGICLGDIGTPGSGGQGDVIMNFLGTVVVPGIFGSSKHWKLESVTKPGIAPDSLAFVANITIAVRQ